MTAFKLIRLIADMLPWIILGMVLYAFWPFISLLARCAQMLHHLAV